MKILFLHLSDLHICDSKNVNLKTQKIADAVRSLYPVEKCVLICSGDITSKGTDNEFKSAKQFFGSLLSKLGEIDNKLIEFYLVPGNHDMLLSQESRKYEDIIEHFKKKRQSVEFQSELKLQDNFFNYANYKRCFIQNRVVDTRVVNYNGFKVQYNLLNTAPFSTLQPNDKELHYLPDEHLYDLVKNEDVDLSIAIMHHSTEWFNHETKNALEKILRTNTDIIFCGHEHIVDTNQNDFFLLSRGGVYSGNMTHESTFSTLILDTDSLNCNEVVFDWNDSHVLFNRKGNKRSRTLTLKKNVMSPTLEFTEKIYDDTQKISKSVLDYFVFPELNQELGNNEGKAVSEITFWDKFLEGRVINITGKNGSGKTTLLKYVFSKSIEKDFFPLYLSSDECPSRTPIDRIAEVLFKEQYDGQQFLFDRYDQLPVANKILFVDNLDSIRFNQKEFLEYFAPRFRTIVFTSHKKLEIDVKTAAKEELIENECYNVKIEDFYREKRIELVKKVCEICAKDSELMNYIIDVIDSLVKRRNMLFELSPEYIVQYIKFFLNKDKDDRKGEAIFNIVFETNLRIAIYEYSSEKHLEHCMLVLEEIAFYMHTNKNERISYKNIVGLIDEVNHQRDLTINIAKCLNIVMSAKIIKNSREENHYEYSNRNYLAYFVAKKLNKMIEKNGFNINELRYVFENICFGINDNILLFLSFLRENTNFALRICEMLSDILGEFSELDFDNNNIAFIKRQRINNLELPTHQEKKSFEKSSDTMEREMRKIENNEIQYNRIYDYDESYAGNFRNRIIRAIKYLEIISKSFISHFVNLESDEKQKIVELMYKAPNQILYALLKIADDNYDEIISELKTLADSVFGVDKISKADIEDVLNKTATGMCLSVYNHVAFFGVNNDTLRLLNNYELKNTNHKVQNLVMIENAASNTEFADKAIALKDSENDMFMTYLIRRIAQKRLLTREVDFKVRDKLTAKLFPHSSKRNLLISAKKKHKKE